MRETTGPGHPATPSEAVPDAPRPDRDGPCVLETAASTPGSAGRHLEHLFRDRPLATMRALEAAAALEDFEAGETIVPDGTEAAAIGYVLGGILAMEKTLADGRRHIIGLITSCAVFGRVIEGPSNFAIRALSPARLLRFDRQAFETILASDPVLEQRFLIDLLDELDAAREWLLLSGGASVQERVATFLLILRRQQSQVAVHRAPRAAAPPVIDLPISRKDCADLLGIRPESLSRAIHGLEAEGLIRLINPYRIELRDLAALASLSGHDLEEHEIRAGLSA